VGDESEVGEGGWGSTRNKNQRVQGKKTNTESKTHRRCKKRQGPHIKEPGKQGVGKAESVAIKGIGMTDIRGKKRALY